MAKSNTKTFQHVRRHTGPRSRPTGEDDDDDDVDVGDDVGGGDDASQEEIRISA